MSLSIGIVGLPNVGKSTLFNALTKKGVLIANYPFATIDPSVGVVAVPDERLYKLAEFSKTQKTVPAAVEFVDIAGLVKGASAGEGLGNKFLTNIRETDAVVEVVRIFEDSDILHVDNKVDPMSDIGVINLELIMADLETVTKRHQNISREIKQAKKEALIESGLLTKLQTALEKGLLASSVTIDEYEAPILHGLHLLTAKKILYVLNKKSGGTNLDEINDERYQKLMSFIKESGSDYVVVDAGIENEVRDMTDAEKVEMREGMGADKSGIDALIKKGYEMLGLITYFTTGELETRAWTIHRGWTAPMAGTAIHGDFKDKFVRAEVIEWDKLLGAGSFANAKEKGLLRIEGKEYIVRDGDVIEFKI
ncbi:MAG: redox-regulated ATPase YchF [Candidatus Taylorbacteria bacterium CG10_big_fil_rev_8_21_14_0_10_41_48]|uniref:Ribosome-binding ATPase YchF n=1 Tax=Candidatus Taylorbacteria bacterium CG10_big_fil_rev_8_21_14_0_10_41_48 TaxID=1975024 RepID=A0A2M8LCD1_9BACT|nr:MAG: redox-regulated ATPase YchF [Candidatus Taylorbacteria bacterium CG10_big_fil_rev_8_21_14_0_10_41_48]